MISISKNNLYRSENILKNYTEIGRFQLIFGPISNPGTSFRQAKFLQNWAAIPGLPPAPTISTFDNTHANTLQKNFPILFWWKNMKTKNFDRCRKIDFNANKIYLRFIF